MPTQPGYSDSFRRVPQFRRGRDRLTADVVNEIRKAVGATLGSGGGQGVNTWADATGVHTRTLIKRAGGGTLTMLRLRVLEELIDDQYMHGYLRCRTWDGITEGAEDVFVAKPPELRHDVRQFRTGDPANPDVLADKGPDFLESWYPDMVRVGKYLTRPPDFVQLLEEYWYVSPAYIINDTPVEPADRFWTEILAWDVGGTGVFRPNPLYDPGDPEQGPEFFELTLEDANRAGRRWAQGYDERAEGAPLGI